MTGGNFSFATYVTEEKGKVITSGKIDREGIIFTSGKTLTGGQGTVLNSGKT
jgi:hypothetical protein